MRLTKIAQAPAHQRNNRHEVQALEHINVLNALLLNHFQGIAKTADGNHHHHRRQDQGEYHQAGLDGIGPAYREEAADKGINNGCRRPGPQRGFVAHAKGAFKQTRAGHNTGSAIDGEK